MRPSRLRSQDGFTLVEVLIAMSVFMLILLGVFQVFEPSNTAYQSSQRKLSVQQNGRIAMDMIVRQIPMAGPTHGALTFRRVVFGGGGV